MSKIDTENPTSRFVVSNGEFDTEQGLELGERVKAGFPSPAEDYMHDSLDFNRDLIKHPEATFYSRVSGDSMIDAGISDGDLAVVDRAVNAEDGDIVIAFVNGEFTIKFLNLKHKNEGYIELNPANKKYNSIIVRNTDEFTVWGVVVMTIKKWK